MRNNNNKSNVAITNNANESTAILEGFKLINANQLINSEDVVVVVPNWVNNKKPDISQAVTVGDESLRTILQFIKGLNPKEIIVAAGSGGAKTIDVMKEVGYEKVLNEENIEFIDLNNGPFKELQLTHNKPNKIEVNKLFDKQTFMISFTQLKLHEEATMSASIKNIALSWPPAEIHGYPKKSLGIHNNLHGFIRSMKEVMPIDLSIISANPVMIGTGPTKGISKHTELVITGTDAVAADTVCARLLGFKPQGVNYLFQCINSKLGQGDLNNINLHGLSILEAEKIFSEAVYGNSIQIDKH